VGVSVRLSSLLRGGGHFWKLLGLSAVELSAVRPLGCQAAV
jgi:hypothetical protein